MLSQFQLTIQQWKQCISPFFHAAIDKVIPDTDYVLEVGYGSSTPILKAKFGKYHLKVLDQSPHVAQHIDYLMDLCVPNTKTEEAWDHIFCIDVLEHATTPWILADNLSNMLSPKGRIIISVPTEFPWHPMLPVCGDYWRFYPGGLEFLFPHLKMIQCDRIYDDKILLGLTAIFQRI